MVAESLANGRSEPSLTDFAPYMKASYYRQSECSMLFDNLGYANTSECRRDVPNGGNTARLACIAGVLSHC